MGELYQITFPNGKSYIGITMKTAQRRLAVHSYRRNHAGYAICRALQKYGKESATVRTLVIANDWAYLCHLERAAIAAYGTKCPDGYNMTDGGEVPSGLTAESLAKMSATHKGKRHHAGFKHSAETIEKMRADRIGKPKNLSQERRDALRASMTGNKFAVGRILTVEHKAAISSANRGKVISEETRERMRAASRAREEAKRVKRCQNEQ